MANQTKCGGCRRQLNSGCGKAIGSTTIDRGFCSIECLKAALVRLIQWHMDRAGAGGNLARAEAAQDELLTLED